MNKLLKVIEDYPFSEKEIMKLAEGKANLVLYPDLKKYKTIDEVLGRHKAAILLYVTQESPDSIFGHWTTIFKIKPNTLEFFDSYGFPPDYQLNFSDLKYPPYLTRLLEKSKYNIIYNTHILQDRSNKNMSTCGRHVGLRLHFRQLPIQQYCKMLESARAIKPTADDIVTLMSAFVK